jgi:hypothetical protein
MLVSELMDGVGAALNNATLDRYTYAVQLPYMKLAYKELQNKIVLEQIQVSDEISSVITLAVGQKALTTSSTPALPTDFLVPTKIQEKLATEAEYHDMIKVVAEPIDTPKLYNGVWAYRENEIKFRGSTDAIQILLTYQRGLNAITSSSSNFTVIGADLFVTYRTAELCARFNAEDNTRAEVLKGYADAALDDFLTSEAHNRQSLTVRRKPFSRNLKQGRG